MMATYEPPGTAVAIAEPVPSAALSLPAVTPDEARAAMRAYQELCESVLLPEDYQVFKERDQVKRFKKKSAVKKLQTFWQVTVTVRDVVRDQLDDEGNFGFRCIATASQANGRVIEATGACSTYEERFRPKQYQKEGEAAYAARCRKALARSYHDVLATAETRATNRAVMNCIGVGGGEVTADELTRDPVDAPPPPAPRMDPAVEAMVVRARALGVIAADGDDAALKAWTRTVGVRWRQAEIAAKLSELEAARAPVAASPAPTTTWHMSEKQKARLFAMHGELKHDTPSRYAFYSRVCGREITTSTQLGKLDYEVVVKALSVEIDRRNAEPS